jgi:hypothetical protein
MWMYFIYLCEDGTLKPVKSHLGGGRGMRENDWLAYMEMSQ